MYIESAAPDVAGLKAARKFKTTFLAVECRENAGSLPPVDAEMLSIQGRGWNRVEIELGINQNRKVVRKEKKSLRGKDHIGREVVVVVVVVIIRVVRVVSKW